MENSNASSILFFDGECNLCNGLVQFVIRRDKKKIFRFASLQSETGNIARQKIAILYKTIPDSFILFHEGKYLIKSQAALYIFKLLGWPWRFLFAGIIIPKTLRNFIYDFIAKNRYKWFGKLDNCMIPTSDIMERFLSK